MRHLPLLLCSSAVALAGAACYRSSGAPVENRPEVVNVTPPPRIAWAEHGFLAERLPAVSADGAAILLGIQAEDGGRGNPNYRFELRDRSDKKLGEHVVLTAEEADTMIDAGGKTPALDARLAAAERWLTEQHAARKLTPLEKLEVEEGEEIASSYRATGGGVTVEWRANRLTIARGGQTLLDRATPATWLAEDRPMPGGPEMCHNPAFLGGAALSAQHKVAVITVRYGGTDTCWEPDSVHHVVAW